MKQLNLTNFFKTKFLYKSINDIKDNDVFTLYDYNRFPRKILESNNIKFDLSFIQDKCILCNKQTIEINEKAKKIALAGSSLMCAIKDKIKIVYIDNTYEYLVIKFDDYTYNLDRTIKWMFGKQKKEYENFSTILNEDYNYAQEILNFVYQYVINIKSNKIIKEIVLPNNELLLIFAITII